MNAIAIRRQCGFYFWLCAGAHNLLKILEVGSLE